MTKSDPISANSKTFEVIKTEKKGRALFAKKDILPGEIILEEIPFMCVPFRSYGDVQRCHVCFKLCEDTTSCQTCSVHMSCKSCEKDYSKIHEVFECVLLKELYNIVYDYNIDETLMLALIKILSKIYVEKKKIEDADFPFSTGNYDLIDLFLSHIDNFKKNEAWYESISGSVDELFKILPDKDVPFTKEDAIEICGKINSNSHGIADSSSTFGIGLYPHVALINHSCDPNAYFTSAYYKEDASKMYCRAIKEIKKGEEITLHYIDLYQTRMDRRKELQETKFFVCECDLCEEDIVGSVDSLVEGWFCDDAECNGVLVNQIHFKENPKKTDWICTVCHKITKKEVIDERIEKIESYMEKSDIFYRSGRYDTAKKYLTTIIDSYANPKMNYHRMQPENSILINVKSKMMNCCTRLNDHIGSVIHCQYLIRCFEKVLPEEIELANYYEHIADIIDNGMKNEKSKSFAEGQSKLKKESLEKAIAIRKYCLGEDHPKTKEARERLSKCAA